MNNCPTVEEVLNLRDRLVAEVAELAGRERKIAGQAALQVGKESTRLEKVIEEEKAALANAIAGQDARFAKLSETLTAKNEQRRRRIDRAEDSSLKRFVSWINGAEGRRKNRIQIALMKAARNYDAGVAREHEAYNRFTAGMREEQDELEKLEELCRNTFAAYSRYLKPAVAGAPAGYAPGKIFDYDDLLEMPHSHLATVREALSAFDRKRLTAFSRYLPLWLGITLLAAGTLAGAAGWIALAGPVFPYGLAALYSATAGILVSLLHLLGRKQAGPQIRIAAENLAATRSLINLCGKRAADIHSAILEDLKRLHDTTAAGLEEKWNTPSPQEDPQLRAEGERELYCTAEKLRRRHERVSRERRALLEKEHAQTIEQLRTENAARIETLRKDFELLRKRVYSDFDSQWTALENEWRTNVLPLYNKVNEINAAAAALFPEWDAQSWGKWQAPDEFVDATAFGKMHVNLPELCGQFTTDSRLAFPGPDCFDMPVFIKLPQQGSLLFETRAACRKSALGALNNIILRLLAGSPPGKVAFTIIDPVELGQNFAGIMHLADFEESIVNSRIWTQPRQIEDRLADLNEHMEKVIQMYLRNEYATIADYNRQAGEIAEKYHFVVVADFPANFSELAVRRMMSIAASGARCGVFLLLHWDQRRTAPQDFVPDELRRNMLQLVDSYRGFILVNPPSRGTVIALDEPPEPTLATAFLKNVGHCSLDSGRVEVPFANIAPPPEQRWSVETSEELRIAIGRTGATKQQFLSLGKGTLQHVLIAGKTGSGKSTLFHVIISNLALWCSPDQVEFYLVDFKKGVEFKCYATHQLPHAKVVAIESDREFGLSVLERVDGELSRRGDLFRKLGVQDLSAYKQASGETLPRTLLIVDEFQEFFVDEDEISRAAGLLLDRIVRQGRAFGIHVLLGSQTLGGAYTLARATLGQMAIRIALQCNEADSYLIMDDDNAAPRLLSRPGEAIYNDAAGRIEGNSPFQIVWLTDAQRDSYLTSLQELAERTRPEHPSPVVFEGNAPAEIESNRELRSLLNSFPTALPQEARIWLGEPNRIKGPTEALFPRHAGSHLLVAGQQHETAFAGLVGAIVALAAQHPHDRLQLVVVDDSPPDSDRLRTLELLREGLPHEIVIVGARDIDREADRLAVELNKRENRETGADNQSIFILISGIQRFKQLRFEEDFGFSADENAAKSAGSHLNEIILKGSGLGMHLIVTCDSYSNLNRFLSRKAIAEFGMRVLFQMSVNDSAALIDTPAAARLGLYRALFHDEQQSYSEIFRPYAMPSPDWLEKACTLIAAHRGKA